MVGTLNSASRNPWPEIPHPGEVVIKPLHSCGNQLYKFFKTEESVYVGKAFQSCRIDMVHQHGHHFNVLTHLFDSCDSVEMILTSSCSVVQNTG